MTGRKEKVRDVFGTEFIFKIFVEKLTNSGFIFEQPVLYLKKKRKLNKW